MERERPFDHDRFRMSGDGLPSGGNLDRHREEVDSLLRASDSMFDVINNLDAQQYLQQNRQSGGQ